MKFMLDVRKKMKMMLRTKLSLSQEWGSRTRLVL